MKPIAIDKSQRIKAILKAIRSLTDSADELSSLSRQRVNVAVIESILCGKALADLSKLTGARFKTMLKQSGIDTNTARARMRLSSGDYRSIYAAGIVDRELK